MPISSMIGTDAPDANTAMIRALAFDAVGTLLHPHPPVAEVYAAVGARFGSRLAAAEIRARFRAAFAAQESQDEVRRWRIDEQRELRRWREIVAAVLDDVSDPAGCFTVLYDHFARPTAWRCEAGIADLFAQLRRRGLQLAVASNFDHRLRSVVAGLPELGDLALVISSEIGWRKPAPEFFAALCATLDLPAAEILLVGDDLGNDYHGARRAGMPSLLLDPAGRYPKHGDRIRELDDLLGWLATANDE